MLKNHLECYWSHYSLYNIGKLCFMRPPWSRIGRINQKHIWLIIRKQDFSAQLYLCWAVSQWSITVRPLVSYIGVLAAWCWRSSSTAEDPASSETAICIQVHTILSSASYLELHQILRYTIHSTVWSSPCSRSFRGCLLHRFEYPLS